MLLQFETEDNSIFVADVGTLNWARVSAPMNPSVENSSLVVESGKLVPQGFGIYAFHGRTKDSPGGDIRTIGNYIVGLGTAIKIFLRANVPIKNFTMPVPITQIRYEILPDDPQQIQHMIEEVQEVSDAGSPASSGSSDSPSDSGGNSTDRLLEDSGQEERNENPGTPASDDPFTEKEVLEDSNQELAEIRDATVEEENE